MFLIMNSILWDLITFETLNTPTTKEGLQLCKRFRIVLFKRKRIFKELLVIIKALRARKTTFSIYKSSYPKRVKVFYILKRRILIKFVTIKLHQDFFFCFRNFLVINYYVFYILYVLVSEMSLIIIILINVIGGLAPCLIRFLLLYK